MKTYSHIKRIMKFGFISVWIFLSGYFCARFFLTTPEKTIIPEKTETIAQIWTCSMHPQIRLPKPGLCPICAMELIPLAEKKETGSGIPELALSPYARKLAQIETTPAIRKFVEATVRMIGKIDYDETRLAYISAYVPGRIDKLYADYTGIPVIKGEHMVYMYSPDLLSAQQELIQAIKTFNNLSKDTLPLIRKASRQTIEAVREKLRLLGITEDQIKAIEKRSEPTDHITIYSPISGIVINKTAVEGMYVDTGTKIYTVADLSRLWLKLDAYESDIGWIKYGQKTEFTTESYPGEIFSGRISFIDPVLNDKTRTVKIRVNIENPEGKLKPGMFARAQVKAKISGNGKVVAPDLAGKWICHMHPEIIKDTPGKCDVCAMSLVIAESLGFAGESGSVTPPLVIPVSAPLITGKRAVVYVESADNEGVYQGREIILGARADGYYIVKSGLNEGEKVVTNGNFKIDSSIQIQAQPSMMNHPNEDLSQSPPEQQSIETIPSGSAEFTAELMPVYECYLKIQADLSEDNLISAIDNSKKLQKTVSDLNIKFTDTKFSRQWSPIFLKLNEILSRFAKSADLTRARECFVDLSDYLYSITIDYGTPFKENLYRIHCPMAFSGRGADWLQKDKIIRNPYFGKTMQKCGEIAETLKPVK